MSQISRSLERRIQELKETIESSQRELAAYEHVLNFENSKEGGPVGDRSESSASEENAAKPKRGRRAGGPNKTALTVEIVRGLGESGANPKDVSAEFKARRITTGKNMVYNTLSYLVSRKILYRRDGKYFAAALNEGSNRKSIAGKKATKKAVKKVPAKKKRQLSPEGLKRIQEALRKRWAAKRAADNNVAAKKAAKKQ